MQTENPNNEVVSDVIVKDGSQEAPAIPGGLTPQQIASAYFAQKLVMARWDQVFMTGQFPEYLRNSNQVNVAKYTRLSTDELAAMKNDPRIKMGYETLTALRKLYMLINDAAPDLELKKYNPLLD